MFNYYIIAKTSNKCVTDKSPQHCSASVAEAELQCSVAETELSRCEDAQQATVTGSDNSMCRWQITMFPLAINIHIALYFLIKDKALYCVSDLNTFIGKMPLQNIFSCYQQATLQSD